MMSRMPKLYEMTVQKVAFSHKGSALRASPPIGNVGLDANLGPPFRLYVLTRNLASKFFKIIEFEQKSTHHNTITSPVKKLRA